MGWPVRAVRDRLLVERRMRSEIIEGCCLTVMRGMDAGSVNSIITDPPYGIAYKNCWSRKFDVLQGDDVPQVDWLPEAFRLVVDPGCLLCFCRWDVSAAFETAIRAAGFTIRSQIIWDRVKHGLGDLEGAPGPRHDIIWFAVKGNWKLPGKRPSSVIRAMRDKDADLRHPTQKPVLLMETLVEAYTSPGDLVLDPFAGSGSTGCACKNLGREFIGIEIDPQYVAVARRRIENSQKEVPLFSFVGAEDSFGERGCND